jgi:hypothetical protein
MTAATILSKAGFSEVPEAPYASHTDRDPVSAAAEAAADGAADGAAVAEPLHAPTTRTSAPKRLTNLGVLCI